jgi:hypothetical protein
LIKARKEDSRSEDKLISNLCLLRQFYGQESIPKNRDKDDDLRSYVNQGLLDGLENSTQKGSKFIYLPTYGWRKIFLGEASYRFIRIPVNQKVFYDNLCQRKSAAEELLIQSIAYTTVKIHGVRKYKNGFFHRFGHYDAESGLQELPEHLLHQTNIKTFNEDEETLSLDVLKSNIQQVLANFNRRKFIL